ncbi:squalene synthase-like isoform X2 [Paroedura picta]|uniref:squalene synthase-like isoform X2 n=1 Tax=Paroedura picta TaxID=143630 RepID=UPI0040576A3F
MDTIEDDMTISLETKVPMLRNFHSYLYQPDWKFMGSKGKDRQLLEDFPTISLEFRNLAKVYQEIIVDVCHMGGLGMVEFLEKKVDSKQDWDKYCHYVSGLVGIGLSRLFSASKLEDPIIGQDTDLANSAGLFLQKNNIIRDYLEDQVEGREFWPREVMAIATLAACYNNKQVFRGVVKIRKGQAVTLMMDATNIDAVKAIVYQYVEEIYQKIPSTDPSSSRTQQIITSIRSLSVPSGALISRAHYSPIYLSCVILLAALSWHYLSTFSKVTEEYGRELSTEL